MSCHPSRNSAGTFRLVPKLPAASIISCSGRCGRFDGYTDKQKKHSRSCAFCLYEVLLAHLAEAHEDCGNLCAGCVILRVQLAVRAVDNAVGNRPLHCVYSVAADSACIREVIQRPVSIRRASVAVQHGNELLTGDVGIRVGIIILCRISDILVWFLLQRLLREFP